MAPHSLCGRPFDRWVAAGCTKNRNLVAVFEAMVRGAKIVAEGSPEVYGAIPAGASSRNGWDRLVFWARRSNRVCVFRRVHSCLWGAVRCGPASSASFHRFTVFLDVALEGARSGSGG